MSSRKSHAIAGRIIPSPRLTLHGALVIAVIGGLPVMTIGLLLDLLVWLLTDDVAGACGGVACLFVD